MKKTIERNLLTVKEMQLSFLKPTSAKNSNQCVEEKDLLLRGKPVLTLQVSHVTIIHLRKIYDLLIWA